MNRVLHPDRVAGILAGVVHLLSETTRDTSRALQVYRERKPEELFPAPTGVPEARVRRRWRLPGLESEDIVFRSLHQPLEPGFRSRYEREYEEVHTVFARRLRPDGSRGRPRLLYLHGYMQPETWVEELAVLASAATRLDMEVVQLQPPYHGRRRPRGSRFDGELYWTADLVRSIEALRQNLLDARTLLSWMFAQDRRPVGVAGLSLGGALTAALTCLEPRFHFSIPLIAHMDLGALLADAPVLSRMRRELREFGWGPRQFGHFMEEIGWDALRPVIPTENIYLMAATDDRFFDPEVVRAMWERWRRPRIDWFAGSHMGFATRVPTAMSRIRSFIEHVTPGTGTTRRRASRAASGPSSRPGGR